MTFEAPDLLWLAVALPLIVALGVWSWTRRRRRAAAALGSPLLLERLGAGDLGAFPLRRLALLVVAAAALGMAAAGPRWGLESVEQPGFAADLVLALDVSRSMLARDVTPNRMERQRVLARRILRELPGDRVGLVVFAGRANVLAPLTADHGTLHLYLDALDPNIVSQGGTALSTAIRQGADLARGPEDAGRGVVVLVSDGESLEERDAVLREADRASRLGVTVHTVGIGTPQGAPVPARPGLEGQVEGYTRWEGEIVTSRLEEELLREIARRTGGRYVRLGDPGATDALLATLKEVDRTEGDPRSGVRERPRYAWFVLLVLALLAVDGTAAGRSSRSTRPARPAMPREERGAHA
jgi:Ca-activated chloride channel homolog